MLSYPPLQSALAMRRINDDLLRVKLWADDHGLQLNAKKCSLVNFYPSSVPVFFDGGDFGVSLGGAPLSVSDSAKILGVTFDRQLTFASHVKVINRAVMNRLRVLFRFKGLLQEEAKLKLVKAVVFPVIFYALPVFGGRLSLESTVLIERLQNSAVRFVYGLRKFDHVSQYRSAARILPLKCVFRLQVACLVHKVLLTDKPSYLRIMLQTRAELRDRRTRQDAMLEVPKVRLEMGRNRFGYFGPLIYNSVSHSFKAYGYASFKKNYRMALEGECFASK